MPVFLKNQYIELQYEDNEIKNLTFNGHAKNDTGKSLRFHVESLQLLLSLYHKEGKTPDGFFTLYANYRKYDGSGADMPGIAFVPFKIKGKTREIWDSESDYLIGVCPPFAKTDIAENEKELKNNPDKFYRDKWNQANPPKFTDQ